MISQLRVNSGAISRVLEWWCWALDPGFPWCPPWVWALDFCGYTAAVGPTTDWVASCSSHFTVPSMEYRRICQHVEHFQPRMRSQVLDSKSMMEKFSEKSIPCCLQSSLEERVGCWGRGRMQGSKAGWPWGAWAWAPQVYHGTTTREGCPGIVNVGQKVWCWPVGSKQGLSSLFGILAKFAYIFVGIKGHVSMAEAVCRQIQKPLLQIGGC